MKDPIWILVIEGLVGRCACDDDNSLVQTAYGEGYP